MNLLDIISITAIVFTVVLLCLEIKRDLMMLQQNSYRAKRYSKWLTESGDSTSFLRLSAIFFFLFSMAGFGVARFAAICVCMFSIFAGSKLAIRRYKKPVVFTHRAIRIYTTALILSALIITGAVVASILGLLGHSKPLYTAMTAALFCYCISHCIILASLNILSPIEKQINRRYYNEAAHILSDNAQLKIIGITGSYGKTSTKHYLYRILSEQHETLMTPGSFNTTLGVIRTIREQLKPYHEIFIVEMGAKQPGDIRQICDLVHPHMGIITAVGPQHLQTFGSVENVLATKFELADAIPSDGTIFVNNDYDIMATRDVDNCNVVRYSIESESPADYKAMDIEYTPTGTSFTVKGPGLDYVRFRTNLLGRYNISDLVGAIALSARLGLSPKTIQYGVSQIEPVQHRLSSVRYPGGLTILDDAYNSNPAGAAMALEVLSSINGGRRFILTPGMIELGERQYELNREFGRQIAQSGIEYAVVICDYNRQALLDGLKDGGMDNERIKLFDTFVQANKWLVNEARPGDTALFENDLPDTFK